MTGLELAGVVLAIAGAACVVFSWWQSLSILLSMKGKR